MGGSSVADPDAIVEQVTRQLADLLQAYRSVVQENAELREENAGLRPSHLMSQRSTGVRIVPRPVAPLDERQGRDLVTRATALAAAGDQEGAVRFLSSVVDDCGSVAVRDQALGQRALLLLRLGRHAHALHDGHELTAAHPDDQRGYAVIGAAYLAMRLYPAAVAMFERARRLATRREHLAVIDERLRQARQGAGAQR
ncbi:Uncharacterized protein PBTT_03275 [Plasmodiophora brassicae]